MALSYEDSIAKYLAESTSNEEQKQTVTVTNEDKTEDYGTVPTALDDTDTDASTDEEEAEEDWEVNENYAWYDEYEDENYSYVDIFKDITLDDNQINLTQESVSQYIPFKMPRYYDGVDLNNMAILFHYVNPRNREGYAAPVNVSCTDDTIKFAWLVDNAVTAVAGTVKFEVCITGFNEKEEAYLWRTLPNGRLNIIESLSGDGVAEPSEDYIISLLNMLDDSLVASFTDELEQYFKDAMEQAASDEYYTASQVDEMIQNAKTEIMEEVTALLNDTLAATLADTLSDFIKGVTV